MGVLILSVAAFRNAGCDPSLYCSGGAGAVSCYLWVHMYPTKWYRPCSQKKVALGDDLNERNCTYTCLAQCGQLQQNAYTEWLRQHYICMYAVRMCVYRSLFLCVCLRRSEVSIRCPPLTLSTVCFETVHLAVQ